MTEGKKDPIRVLVVDDSFFMRKVLTELLNDTNGETVVLDTASNGLEALEKNKTLKPDVITLDVEMPKMDGLAALEKIMKENPTPVIMLSSHTGKGTETTILALELGAVDCVAKPAGRVLGDVRGIRAELVEKIKTASLSRLRYRRSVPPPSHSQPEVEKKTAKVPGPSAEAEKPAQFIVAVASSTGGPRALNELFSRLSKDMVTAFVVVQHISVGFTKALARRLSDVTQLRVSEAVEGEYLMGGHVYVAPGAIHLAVEGGPGCFRTVFSDLPPRLGVKPSADIMMTSVAKAASQRCLGVVLTGMGRDGTEGLKEIKKAGGKTLAQDEESCVVYGMPKSAVESGAADKQLTLPQMAAEINAFLAYKRG